MHSSREVGYPQPVFNVLHTILSLLGLTGLSNAHPDQMQLNVVSIFYYKDRFRVVQGDVQILAMSELHIFFLFFLYTRQKMQIVCVCMCVCVCVGGGGC